MHSNLVCRSTLLTCHDAKEKQKLNDIFELTKRCYGGAKIIVNLRISVMKAMKFLRRLRIH
jgi:hypothetical protein